MTRAQDTGEGGDLRSGGRVTADARADHETERLRHGARSLARRRLKIGLMIWDVLVPVAVLSLSARFGGFFGEPLNGGAAHANDVVAVVLALLAPVGLGMAGAYNYRRRRGSSRLMFGLRLLLVGVCLSWVTIIVSSAAGWPVDFSQMLVAAVLLPAGWLMGRWVCDRHPDVWVDRVLLVGSGTTADRVVDLASRRGERRLQMVGRLSDGRPIRDDRLPMFGALPDLLDVVARERIDRIVVAFAGDRDPALLERLRLCVAEGVQVDVVPRLHDLLGPTPRAHPLGGLTLLEIPGVGLTILQRTVKRGVDIAGASALLLLLAIPLGLVALAIRILDGAPVLFRQTRVGRAGREFSIFKFRTMRTDADSAGVARLACLADEGEADIAAASGIGDMVRELKSDGEARITPLGDLLRKTSVDELPQLINVLRGDMSLVGPRPLRPFEVGSLAPWQRVRQDLRPGLTGLWQVLGRSDLEWEERMQLDYSYVSHWSLASDLRILARTLPAVIRKEGAV